MNLLFTLTAYPPSIGGTQLLMHQLARQFMGRHSVQVVTQWDTHRTDWLLGTTVNAPPSPRAYVIDGIPVQRIALDKSVRLRLLPWVLAYYPLQDLALPRIADALAVEVTPWARDVDLIHNSRIGREGLSYASLQLARQRDVPFVLTPVHHPRWRGWLYRHYHHLYRQADAVIALTEAERQTLVGLGVDEHRVFVTGMGPIIATTHDGSRFRERYGLGDSPLVLFLGEKFSYKGLRPLLGATELVWDHCSDARFLFVGPRTSYSRRLFSGIHDSRIIELDTVDLQEKTDALAACDILCLPSAQESFGGVFTEAWSLGKPVVGCDIPAVRAVIDNGRDGLLAPQEPGPIAECILHLLEQPALRTQMGQRGRDKVDAFYSWQRLAEKTELVYERVLHGA